MSAKRHLFALLALVFPLLYGCGSQELRIPLEDGEAVWVEAIKGIKFDNVTVWDSGNGADGKGSTANFLSGLLKSVPPMSDLFNMAGLNLPEYLAKKQEAEAAQAEEVKDDKKKK